MSDLCWRGGAVDMGRPGWFMGKYVGASDWRFCDGGGGVRLGGWNNGVMLRPPELSNMELPRFVSTSYPVFFLLFLLLEELLPPPLERDLLEAFLLAEVLERLLSLVGLFGWLYVPI